MKYFLTLLLLSSFTSLGIASTQVRTIVKKHSKKNAFVAQKYKDVICKQKYIPMKIEQSLNSHLLKVTFTSLEKIDSFSITNVRGLKDVSVTKYQEIMNQALEVGDTVESSVELSDFTGLVYVVFDVSITINGVKKGESIPIPVGSLSKEQILERSKSIKEYKRTTVNKEGTSPISVPPEKYHEMELDK